MSPPQGNSRCVDPELGAHPDAHAVDASDPTRAGRSARRRSWPWPRSIARWHRAAASNPPPTSPRGPRSAGRGWGGFVRRLSSKADGRAPAPSISRRSTPPDPVQSHYDRAHRNPDIPDIPRQGRGHPAR